METLENCRFCLMCTHVAPVGQLTKQEALTPHGVALTVTSQKRGLIDWNEETVGVVFSEADGGNSRIHCVNSQPFEEAVAAARAELVQKGLAPTAVTDLKAQFEQYQTPFAAQSPRPASGKGELALFVGDEAAYLGADMMPVVLKLLSAAGVEPVLVGAGRSNGFIAQSAGLPEVAKVLVQSTLDEVTATGAGRLLVLSAGDYYFFTQAMTERLGMARPSGLEIIEVTGYLADQLAAGKIAFKQADIAAPAYVDPTHAVRVPVRHEKVRRLATAVLSAPLIELFFRQERAHPAGSTQLQFTRPELADRLTHGRLQDAQARGARTLICEDPATLYQLGRFAGAYGLQVKGLYDLLAEQIV